MRDRDGSPGQRGSASLVMLGVVVLALVCCLTLMRVGVAAIAGARAETAADAAALAAADMLALGRDPAAATAAAAHTARANGAELSACACRGPLVTVRVAVGVPAVDGTAHASARAEVRFRANGS